MKYEVWKQTGDEHCSKSLVMFPALNRDNEAELMRQGYQVCHVFEAPNNERAQSMMADWIMQESGLTRMLDRDGYLHPVVTHTIKARMVDGMIPVDDDCKAALAKHIKSGTDCQKSDLAYVRSLEDENAELHTAMREGHETVQALMCRVRDLTREREQLRGAARKACYAMTLGYGDEGDLLEACEAVERDHGGAMEQAYHDLRVALDPSVAVPVAPEPEETEEG